MTPRPRGKPDAGYTQGRTSPRGMTGRQRQVLEEILAGATQTEIARKMFLDRRVIHRIVEQLVTRGLLRALSKRGQYELTYAGKVVVGQQKAEPIEDDIEQKEEPTDR